MRRLTLAAAVALGCSNANNTTTAADASVPEAATDAPQHEAWVWDGRPVYPEITCGPGPYVDYTVQPIGQLLAESSKKQPFTKIKISLSACPEVKGETDEEGYALVRLTIGQPVSIRLDAMGWLPTRIQEITPQKWSESPFLSLFDPEVEKHLPGFDKGVVVVDAFSATGSLECTGPHDVKITVVDHPEAVVTYHEASSPFAPKTGATMTTPSGIASITGLAAGTKVTIKGEKAGCDVVVNAAPGGVLVEPGVVSRATLVVRDPYVSCGPPPWILLEGKTTTREPAGTTGAPVEGVSVGWDGCSGVAAKTAGGGLWHAWVSTNLPATRRYDKADFLPTLTAEQAWPVDYSTLDLALRNAATWKPLMPGYDATHAYAAIGVGAPKTGPCAGGQDVTIAIKGHPDAKVLYVDGDPPKDTGGKVTTKRGLVYVSGLTPGELTDANVTATREGCVYSLKGDLDTGRAKLEAGAFTIATLYARKAP